MSSPESKKILKEGAKNLPAPPTEFTEIITQHPLIFIDGIGFTFGATAAFQLGSFILKAVRK